VIFLNFTEEEIIRNVFVNLKNWSAWDFSDFRLNKQEGEAVKKVLELYLSKEKEKTP